MNTGSNGDNDGSSRGHKHSVNPELAIRESAAVELDRQMLMGDAAIGSALACILHHDSGYLKIRPDMLGREVHCTWTWVYGLWKGHYVYVVTDRAQIAQALELLLQKMAQVNANLRRPTPDKRREVQD